MVIISAKMENINTLRGFDILLILFLSLVTLCRSFELDGSSESYGKFSPWQPCSNGSVSFQFKTHLNNALLFYADGIGNGEYYELKLVDGILNLRYMLQNERFMLTNGQMLGNNQLHTVDILRENRLTTLRVDELSYTSEHQKYDYSKENYEVEEGKFVYIGGLPRNYNDRLQLATVVHEPHFQGSIQNLFFGNCGKPLARPKDMGSEGLVLENDECLKNNPCINGGICVTRPRGVQCDCSFTDFTGRYCEMEKQPVEAMFHGTQYLSYDLTNGGGPIESGKDVLSLKFRTTYSNGLLFYSGNDKDYMTVSIQHGAIRVSTELGTGVYSVTEDMDGYKLDDGQWHHLMVKRDSREIAIEIDGVVRVTGTTLGNFDKLSSNIIYVGGSPMTPSLPGADVSENFRGCLKEVVYTADAMTLKLIDLADNKDPLITVFDVTLGQCEEVIESQPITFTTPDSFIALPRFDVSRKRATITFQFTTVEPNSVIIYNGGSFERANTDFFALEIIDGYIYLLLDLGSGAIKERASRTRVDDGFPHIVFFQYGGKNGFIKVDAHQTDYTTPGHRKQLELDQMLHIGGLNFNDRRIAFSLPKELWSGTLKHGYVGCLQDLIINNNKIDLMTVARKQRQRDIVSGCLRSGSQCDSQPCTHRGKCIEGWNRFICDCRATEYTGNTCGEVATTLSFDGAQYVSIFLPTESVTEAEDISIRFRTTRGSGLLLMTASSQASDSIEMYLEHGSFKFTINLGTKSKTLSLGKALNDDQWHTVFVKRRGQNLELAVDNGHPVTDNIHHVATTIKMTQIAIGSAGPILSDTYGQPNTDISFDEMRPPMMMQRDGRAPHAGFVGALQQFIFNGNHYFEIAKKTNHDNIEITARFDNGESVTKDPVTFETAHSYVEMPKLKANDIFTVYFKFKTSKTNGLIMFNGSPKKDFLGMELFQGYLYYVYNMGSGPERIRINTPEPLDDNKWHDVSLLRTNTERHVMRVDNHPATVDNMQDRSSRRFDLDGPMFLGGVFKSMYNSLPKQFMAQYGFVGCLASLVINGPSVNILKTATRVEHRVVKGCSSSNMTCHANSCFNRGRCVPQWKSYACDCDMTSFTGPSCLDEHVQIKALTSVTCAIGKPWWSPIQPVAAKTDSVTYRFGMDRGLVTFEYDPNLRPSTNSDTLALGIKTIQDYAILVRVDSAKTDDYIQMELVKGNVMVLYNMGHHDAPIGDVYAKVNDNQYHVIKLKRLGANATLQVDDREPAYKYPMETIRMLYPDQEIADSQMTVFNDQARVWIGGRKNKNREIENAYHGIMSGLFFNGHRILDYLKDGDQRVTAEGDLKLVSRSDAYPPLTITGNDKNNIQSTQGTKVHLRYKRADQNSARRRNKMTASKTSTQPYWQYKNLISKNFIIRFLNSDNHLSKGKPKDKFIPSDKYVHRNTAQNPYNHSTSVKTLHNGSNKTGSILHKKDHFIGGNVGSIYSSGNGRLENGDTEDDPSGYSIFGSGDLISDDDELRPFVAKAFIKAREKYFRKLLKMYKLSNLNNENIAGSETPKVKVETLRGTPFVKQYRVSKNTYPKDRGKASRFKNRREFPSSLQNSNDKKHSKGITPKQSTTDDNIIHSGSGPYECINIDDEEQCITPGPEPTDEIITASVKITNRPTPRPKKNNSKECKDNKNSDCDTTGGTQVILTSDDGNTTNVNTVNTLSPGGDLPNQPKETRRKDNGHLNIFLIIGIVAGVLVALIILVIALYKFRSREEGSYRVDESQNFAYLEAKKQQTNGSAINTMGNGKVGGKKKDVKEWYV